jgi:hypothetical protein
MEENKQQNTDEESKKENPKFVKAIDDDNLKEVKTMLTKIKIILEKKLDDKIEEIIELKQNLPHLIHLKRMNQKIKDKNNDSSRSI